MDICKTFGFLIPSSSISSLSFCPGVCFILLFWLLPFCCFMKASRLGASCTRVKVAEKTKVCLLDLVKSILSSRSRSSWKWPRSIIRSASSITKHLMISLLKIFTKILQCLTGVCLLVAKKGFLLWPTPRICLGWPPRFRDTFSTPSPAFPGPFLQQP